MEKLHYFTIFSSKTSIQGVELYRCNKLYEYKLASI